MNQNFDSDQDYMDSIAAEPEPERDPRELSLERSPEADGLERFSIEDQIIAEMEIMRTKIVNVRDWVAKQIGAFPKSPESQGSDLMAARVVAEMNIKFQDVV